MRDDQFRDRALNILHNMAIERKGWRGFLQRWYFHHEPLRNDAANLLREYGQARVLPLYCGYVGCDADDARDREGEE